MSQSQTEKVQEYYGKTLKTKDDLQTSACCLGGSIPNYQKTILSQIQDEVLSKFYGCGSPIPFQLSGQTVLDLGSGSGRDVFLCSKLVGDQGKVIGVDMTAEQLQVAQKHAKKQAEIFGLSHDNTQFQLGQMEDLKSLGIADNSVDVVISNCVVNLSDNKGAVFKEIFRVLREGGELYFSDVFSDRRMPKHLYEDKVVLGECLGGAMYIEDFRRMLLDNGIKDYRIVTQRPLNITNPSIKAKTKNIQFQSITIRAFNLPNHLEDKCEDYGQVAIYQGGIEHSEYQFILDNHHVFEEGRPMLVCGNTAAMLQETRFRPFFKVVGDRSQHYGLFPCSDPPQNNTNPSCSTQGGCC